VSYTVRPQALEDLEQIWSYSLDIWGEAQADAYIRQISITFATLATSPLLAIDAGHIREAYRKYKVGRHLIFYRIILDEGIEIVRILHERMDVDEQFADG
jgi:toxin ParE1/3/4